MKTICRSMMLMALVLWLGATAQGGQADVVAVKVSRNGDLYHFDVTVQHDDSGWDHYANKWEVLAPDGSVLGTRVLYHPHVNEQPFTRSLSGVKIPDGITQVTVRSYDSVHDAGGKEVVVDLTGAE